MKQEKIKLTEQTDILNGKTKEQEIENELLNTDTIVFTYYFSNYGNRPEVLRIFRNRAHVCDIKGSKLVSSESFQDIPNLSKLETEFHKSYYDELVSIKRGLHLTKIQMLPPNKHTPKTTGFLSQDDNQVLVN